MSLLSDYGPSGLIGGVDYGVQRLRMQNLTGPAGYNTANSGSYNFRDTGTEAVQYSDMNPTLPDGNLSVVKIDFANKTSQFYHGPNKTAATTPIQTIIGNPFGGWLMFKPGVGPSYIHYTTDGNTYINTNQEDSSGVFWYNRFGGGYFDGTTFAYINTNSQFVYTTNGTSFTTANINGAGARAVWGKNNYNPYSGYWFYVYNSGYGYTTSPTVTGTTVAGYRLCAMSANGRYLMRRNNSTYAEEYSTDGGASWSSFAVPIPQENGKDSGGSAARVASNSGQFFSWDQYGAKLYVYDFSASVWRLCAAFDNLDYGTVQSATPLYIEGVEVMHVYLAQTTNTYLVEMPKGIN